MFHVVSSLFSLTGSVITLIFHFSYYTITLIFNDWVSLLYFDFLYLLV